MMPTSPDVQLRPATTGDARAIATIYNQYIADGNYTMDTVPWSETDVALRLSQLHEREQLFVICAGEQVAGWGIVKRYSERNGYRVSCETSLYLDRQYTGRGLGSHMMRALFDTCQQFGYHHAVARIRAANEASIRFHEQHGFEWVGRQREIGYVNGRWADVVIMQRIFADVGPPRHATGSLDTPAGGPT